VLSNDSIMVNMLMPIFPPLVLRCAILVVAEIAFVLLIGLLLRLIGYRKVTAAVADIVTVEHDANEPVAIDGPDLVLAHRLRNAPVSQREELKRRAKKGLPLEVQKPRPEPEAEPVIELRTDAPQSADEPTDEPDEPAEEPVIELRGDEPDEPAEEPAEEPVIELRGDEPDEPVEEPAEEPVIELRGDAADEPAKEPEQKEQDE
jgi:hypothetical protein